MLAETKLKTFLDIVSRSKKDELIWMNGYLSGLIGVSYAESPPGDSAGTSDVLSLVRGHGINPGNVSAESPGGDSAARKKITIAYGTETGNSKKLAADFAAKAKKSGVQTKLVSLDQYKLHDLPKEENFLAIISTHGEGEPPAAAKKFYDHIHNNGFKLDKLKYGVLALGDTSYPLFCKAGEDVDGQLQKLGGNRIAPLQKCDIDYEDEAITWFNDVLQTLSPSINSSAFVSSAPVVKKSTGRKIYKGKIIKNINLNDRGSNKQTHHIEIAAEGLEYQPGDAIGIIPPDPLSNGRISPRLYSIASSLQLHEGEVHITVVRKQFYINDQIGYGLCSNFLSQLPEEAGLEFYVHRNNMFRLPSPDKDIIMIGPGTGIAPFRSFLAERDATGATGKNWLFFGDQCFQTDFLYQTEIMNWIDTGVLTKVNVAFSRDQQEKLYVQHKMLKHADEIFEWLQSGAYIYVCGTKEPMSVDVENVLLQIIESRSEDAAAYLDKLKEEGRYLKDVY